MLLGILLLFWNFAAAIFRNDAADWNYAAVPPKIKISTKIQTPLYVTQPC